MVHSPESAVNWIYAWAGTLGQEFNEREVHTEVKRKIDWRPAPTRVIYTESFGASFGQEVSIGARLVGPNSAGRRMVLVSSYDGLVRVMRVETTDDDGNVTFNLPGLIRPTPDVFRPLPSYETILVFWDRNGNNIHDGPAELSAQATIYWS